MGRRLAAISLAVITDVGEGTNIPYYCEQDGSTTSWTSGPLIWLTGENSALDLGPKKRSDIFADYDTDCPSKRGNYSLPIYKHELLFASEKASTEFRKDKSCDGKHVVAKRDPRKLEFRKYFPLIYVPFFVNIVSYVSSFCYSFQLGTERPTQEGTIHELSL